jgi:hypothetical protein
MSSILFLSKPFLNIAGKSGKGHIEAVTDLVCHFPTV